MSVLVHARCKDGEALEKCHQVGMLVCLSRAAGWERARPGLHSTAGCVGSGMCGCSGVPTLLKTSRGCRAQQSRNPWTSCRSRSASRLHPRCHKRNLVTFSHWVAFKGKLAWIQGWNLPSLNCYSKNWHWSAKKDVQLFYSHNRAGKGSPLSLAVSDEEGPVPLSFEKLLRILPPHRTNVPAAVL